MIIETLYRVKEFTSRDGHKFKKLLKITKCSEDVLINAKTYI